MFLSGIEKERKQVWIYENDKRGVTFISAGFIVSGCVLAGLIGALFL